MCALTDGAAVATRAPDQFGGDALNNDSTMLRATYAFPALRTTKRFCLLD